MTINEAEAVLGKNIKRAAKIIITQGVDIFTEESLNKYLDELLNFNIEPCKKCGIFMKGWSMIPPGRNEPDGFCDFCRPLYKIYESYIIRPYFIHKEEQ